MVASGLLVSFTGNAGPHGHASHVSSC